MLKGLKYLFLTMLQKFPQILRTASYLAETNVELERRRYISCISLNLALYLISIVAIKR